MLEEKEENLSPYAAKSRLSRGRERPENPSPVRTDFQRDRDRIIHCNAFRRLKHKTQVFITPLGDHYVTRLTHTLEVSQIARTISRALNLNEDLTEAISLGHDLGHTPFGHIGEDMLNELYPSGFHHNEQSKRVVEFLENNGQGLNLTWEVRDGIVKHSKSRQDILGEEWEKASTFEAGVCKISDAIAYINHDIGDAIRAGVIVEGDLPEAASAVLGRSYSQRIDTMVCDIVATSWSARGEDSSRPLIAMSERVREATNTLRDFLFERVYDVSSAAKEATKARKIVRLLYSYMKEHPDNLPEEYLAINNEIERSVVDYIAGMTDQFAESIARHFNLL